MQKEQLVIGKAYRVTEDNNDYSRLEKDSIVYVTYIGYQGAMLASKFGLQDHWSERDGNNWSFHLFFDNPWEWLEEIEEKKGPFITLELTQDQAETLTAILAHVGGHPKGYRGDINPIFDKLELKVDGWYSSPQNKQLNSQGLVFEDTK